MTDLDESGDAPKASKGRKGLIVGALAALVLGAAGFAFTYFGLADSLLGPSTATASDAHGASDSRGGHGADTAAPVSMNGIAYVPVEPIVASLSGPAKNRYLRFSAQLEVASGAAADISHLMPRVQDVLNGYLRAVDPADIEDPAAMERLRAQMLRRVRLVTGGDRVHDVLITEFVLN